MCIKMVDFNKIDEEIQALLGFCSIIFVIGYVLAVFNYPDNYNLFDNFISDLGRVTAPNGSTNGTSSAIFLFIMILGGLMLILFFLFSPRLLYRLSSEQISKDWKLEISKLLGVLAGICMGLIGYFHEDTQHQNHITIGYIFFGLIIILMILYSWFLLEHAKDPKSSDKLLTAKNVVLNLVIIIVILIGVSLILYPSKDTRIIGSALVVFIIAVFFLTGVYYILAFQPFPILKSVKTQLINGLEGKRYTKLVKYETLIISEYVLLLVVIVIGILGVQKTVKPVVEVVVVFSTILWVFVINLRLFVIALKT